MSDANERDVTRTRETDFAALWSSDGITRSMSPTGAGLPADLPFLFSGGQQFGGYEIARPLGKGGMGQVYEAEEIDSGRRIALKLLSRGLGDDEERERFLREGRLAASLSHPNCVYVFGTSEIQGFPVIAMELVPQGTLKDLVVPGTPMTAAAAVDAMLQGIAGLDAAAALGILHRDIKPSNCFVHRDGRVLVGDFGLSVAAVGFGAAAGTILGTPGFASPEQLRGDPLDVRSDIYSVGATLFYLLAGRAPFDERNTTDLLTKVATQPAPSLTTLRPELPRRLAYVVSRCLAKAPQERFAGYAALTAALQPFSSTRVRHAPIVRRTLAGWIDRNVVLIPTVVIIRLIGLQSYSVSHPGEAVLAGAIGAALMTLYYGVLEGHWGAGAGKAIFGLRVVDADHVAPGVRRGIRRALAFALVVQTIVLIVRLLVLGARPEFSIKVLDSFAIAVSLVALFATARRSNGWLAFQDRVSRTRVVRRRVDVEARVRAERSPQAQAPFEGDARIGPYLVPSWTPATSTERVSVEGFDDRLHRRVWIELLPARSAPVAAARRDLDRPSRVRWLGGKRQAAECWDAYEAVDGLPIGDAVSTPQPWARVRYWIGDLARELTAGLEDGSLPPLLSDAVWIGSDDRARLVEWRKNGSMLERLDGATADLAGAQKLLYNVAVAALLGVTVQEAASRQPATPLPISARAAAVAQGREVRVCVRDDGWRVDRMRRAGRIFTRTPRRTDRRDGRASARDGDCRGWRRDLGGEEPRQHARRSRGVRAHDMDGPLARRDRVRRRIVRPDDVLQRPRCDHHGQRIHVPPLRRRAREPARPARVAAARAVARGRHMDADVRHPLRHQAQSESAELPPRSPHARDGADRVRRSGGRVGHLPSVAIHPGPACRDVDRSTLRASSERAQRESVLGVRGAKPLGSD